MKTVYFPYTHIDPRLAEQMAAVWGRLTLLQPSVETCLPAMASLQEAGVIETIFPASDTQISLKDVLQDLNRWAAQHTGRDLAVMMEQRQTIPFFNSQSSAQIVAEIRKGGKTPAEDPAAVSRNNVFRAQLLLTMAQEFDFQQAALTRDIETLSAKESEMMAFLKGEDVVDTPPPVSSWASGASGSDPRTIPLRLNAWARAMATVEGMDALSGKKAEILFLTTGRGVLAQIEEIFSEAETRLRGHLLASGGAPGDNLERLPAWLADPLTADRRDVSGADGGLPPGLDLVEIPRISVAGFLLRLSGRTSRDGSEEASPAPAGSCWIGCLTRPDKDR